MTPPAPIRNVRSPASPSILHSDIIDNPYLALEPPPNPGWAFLMWHQATLKLPAFPRGFHLITRNVLEAIPDVDTLKIGLLHVFIQHTSASLTLNENADPDVRADFETAMNHAVPESLPYVHTVEGPDDMPAHVKSSLLGSSVTIPIRDGQPALGTWQGIYLCEHRDHGGPRSLVLTLCGE